MKLLLASFGVALASALFPFVNLEAYLTAVAVADDGAGLWLLAGVVAVGQTIGKLGLYLAGDQVMRIPWLARKMAKPSWQRSFVKWRNAFDEHPRRTAALLFASASVGIPPLYVVAILAGHLRLNVWLFLTTCLTGRFVRFVVLLGAADWIVHLF